MTGEARKVFVALLECRHFEHLLKENSGVDVKWLVEDFAKFSALLEANRVRKINHDQYKDTARYFPLAEEGESRECLGSWINSSACGTRDQAKASQASDYVLISMREMATHDWRACEPGM